MESQVYVNNNMNKIFHLLSLELLQKMKSEKEEKAAVTELQKKVERLEKKEAELKRKLKRYETKFKEFDSENKNFINSINCLRFKGKLQDFVKYD